MCFILGYLITRVILIQSNLQQSSANVMVLIDLVNELLLILSQRDAWSSLSLQDRHTARKPLYPIKLLHSSLRDLEFLSNKLCRLFFLSLTDKVTNLLFVEFRHRRQRSPSGKYFWDYTTRITNKLIYAFSMQL